MNSPTPELSICIATMNRARQLLQTVEALLAQIDERCEIVIVDGASRDMTEDIGRQLAADDERVRYFREPINSGVDADYDRAVGYAEGKYCWLLTDDDRILPRAINRILDQLAKQPALLLVNASVSDANDGRRLVERRLALDNDRVYPPEQFESLFKDTIRYLSFIGAVVIRRDIWLARDRNTYYGTAFIHIGVIFQARLPGLAIAMAEPALCLQYGHAGWRSRAFEIWVIRWPRLIWSFDMLATATRRSVCPREPWGDARYLLLHRALGNYGPNHYATLVANQLQPGWRKAVAWAAARVPARLLNLIAWAYFSRPGAGVPMLLADLEAAPCHWRKTRRP